MGYLKGILYRNLLLLAGVFWVSLRTLRTSLFDFFGRTMFRRDTGGQGRLSSLTESEKVSDDDNVVVGRVRERIVPDFSSDSLCEVESLDDTEDEEEEGLNSVQPEGKESPKFLSFKFPSLEECSKRSFDCEEEIESVEVDVKEALSWGRSAVDEELSVDSDFSPESLMIEKVATEPSPDARVSHELEMHRKLEVFGKEDFGEISEVATKGSPDARVCHGLEMPQKLEVFGKEDFSKISEVATEHSPDGRVYHELETPRKLEVFGKDDFNEISEVATECSPDGLVYRELEMPRKPEVFGKEDFIEISAKFHWLSEKESLVSESDSDSMSSSHDFSLMSRLLDSNSEEGFVSDGDLDEVFELNKIVNSTYANKEEEKSDTSTEDEDDIDFKDCEGRENTSKDGKFDEENLKPVSADQSSTWDGEEDSKLESMWEHQDLIEQIKMELEKARRATGLPTIPEDSEGPKITEDLKPWKIDDRDQHEETIGNLHKVYRSYRERMRKFDILNYQKMYALGFLQTKDPIAFASSQKPTSEGMALLLSQTLKMCRDEKKPVDNPMVTFVRELHGDLETVYVGQMCLSWEFLHWQYTKALELWESDQDSLRRYNEVAGEFQQFQVVLQRFLENERFEGTRVQCYVRTRHFLRNLVQIPVIKEDSSKDRRRAGLKGKDEYVASSDELVEILEESIRMFWRFVRADKDSSHAFPKGRRGIKPQLQNPKDSELLAEVQTTLEKKEKKLKEILKGGNCILRKFQKQRDDHSSDHVLYFFSQVDMKLVRRVLNMSRLTTDQISWCSGKLSRIVFVRRKIHVEPSFSLFPC
ncbi:hypothetical protein MLD38_033909 [Melastoma candidum]|uniref:Uncharacterized protein n=1 Tax=Melastoma candidum TaxID=119954 RepID=A0ACB9MA39_9MYRT|nr:hypothetical protein MLD38_033909 [Melastoma candidum]